MVSFSDLGTQAVRLAAGWENQKHTQRHPLRSGALITDNYLRRQQRKSCWRNAAARAIIALREARREKEGTGREGTCLRSRAHTTHAHYPRFAACSVSLLAVDASHMANEPYAGMHIDRFDGGAPVPHGALGMARTYSTTFRAHPASRCIN